MPRKPNNWRSIIKEQALNFCLFQLTEGPVNDRLLEFNPDLVSLFIRPATKYAEINHPFLIPGVTCHHLLLQKPDQVGNGVLLPYMDMSCQCLLSRLDRVQKRLRGLVGDEFLPNPDNPFLKEETLQTSCYSLVISMETVQKTSNVFVLPVPLFTDNIHQVTLRGTRH